MGDMQDFGDLLLKAEGDDRDTLWSPHESPFIRWLVEKWTSDGLNRFGSLQSELARWVDFQMHKAGSMIPRPPVSEFVRWSPGELKLVKAYLESVPPGRMALDDWFLVVDYLYQRYLPPDVLLSEAELLAVRAQVMGRVAANHASISAGKAAQIAGMAPSTVSALMESSPGMTSAQKATLEFGKARCCEYVTQLSDNARIDMRKMIVDYQEQVVLGGSSAPREALQTRLLDRFGTMNRDWRRIAITEAGNNMLNGMIGNLPFGTRVKRIEMYRGACAFCRKWDGAVFEVVDPKAPNKDGETQIWLGKSNVGRSASPNKRSGAGLIPRTESEMWWPTVDLFHPLCRGRWMVVS